MTSRRRWLRPSAISHSNTRYTREYECLDEDSPPQHFSLTRPRRSIVVTKQSPSTTLWRSRTKYGSNGQPTALLDEQPSSKFCCTNNADIDGFGNMNTPVCWPGMRVVANERIWGKETEEDEDDDMFHFTKPFTEKYYSTSNQLNPKQDSANSRKGKPTLFDTKVGLSQSFETQETQLEESSETSLCTTDDETDRSSKSASNSPQAANLAKFRKRVQWPDEQSGGALITKVHALEYAFEVPYTCRVVILLLMDRGAQSEASNFEFLHCEFRHDDRLRVCDALPQITQLVLGTAPPPDSTNQPSEPFRPFTRLYLDGRELINSLALQDYCLEDGQSTLVALREPLVTSSKDSINTFTDKERRDALLRQSELLLADKRLRRGIRKARIAGRSLQILYGLQGMQEEKERLANKERNEQVANAQPEEHELADIPDEPWSIFDTLARTSFDSDDLKDTSGTFDVEFYEGINFFRQLSLQLQSPSTEPNDEVECFFESALDPGYEWPIGDDFVDNVDRNSGSDHCDPAVTAEVICS